MAGSWRPHVLPATSMDLTTLFTRGSSAKTIIWTSGSSLADLGTASTTSDVEELMQRLYSDVTRIKNVEPMNFVGALIRSIRGNDSWQVHERGMSRLSKDYTEAATELVKPTYQGRNTSLRLRSKIHEVATAIKMNAAHRTLLLTDDCRIGLSYHPTPETGIYLGDTVTELFRFPCCSLHFILRPMEKVYHKMINVTSMWHTTNFEYDGHLHGGDWVVRDADIHTRDRYNAEAKLREEDFGLMVASDSITPRYLEELKVQFRRHNTELYAIK